MTDTPARAETRFPGARTRRLRALAALIAALLAAVVARVAGASWPVTGLCASDAAALAFVSWVWSSLAGADADATAKVAREEDPTRVGTEGILVAAALASLIAVGFTLVQAGHARAPARGWLTGLTFLSVALAWASIHTVYMLQYARMYYSDPPGGIDFHGEAPGYLDFGYLALTIGMTFQVSDTDLMTKRIRRRALHHALLSYLFGTVILGVTVNITAALLSG